MVFFFVRKIVDYGTEMRIHQGTFTKIELYTINKKELPNYLSRAKVISGATSADRLQHHLLEKFNKAI